MIGLKNVLVAACGEGGSRCAAGGSGDSRSVAGRPVCRPQELTAGA